jgi:hypothetical protein
MKRVMAAKLYVGAVLVTAVAGMVPAAAAYASDPSGCSASTTSFGASNTGVMTAKGSGTCSGSATRTLRVEIKHNLTVRPDSLVAAQEDNHTGKSFAATVSSCDHGNSAEYYGRTFFRGGDYHDSSHKHIDTC